MCHALSDREKRCDSFEEVGSMKTVLKDEEQKAAIILFKVTKGNVTGFLD